jgi:succinylglutamate desuccinylase
MRTRLEKSVIGLPAAVEICLRYHVEEGERFTMLPGFESFQPVRQGELLALGGKSGVREIRCPVGSILLMPRYQGQGADGFFLARKVDLVA